MPTLDIGGQRVQVGDDFLKLSPEQQQSTVDEIAGSLPKAAASVGVNDVVRSAASGVAGGGLLNKMNAATNAALAPAVEPFLAKGPETLDQPTFGERYSKSLELQNKRDERFATDHPVIDTTAKIAGGVGSLTGAALRIPGAAYSLGMTGTLPGMIGRGALSGAAIGAGDAATRGEDAGTGALVGGALGGAGPVAGRVVGKAYDKVAGALRPKAPVPQRVIDVNGVKVPMSESAITRDPAAAAQEQVMLRGGAGDPAQAVATGARDETRAALKTAEDNFAAGLDPTGNVPKVTPETAGQTVATDLVTQEQQRAAAEVARIQNAASERARIGASMAPFDAAEHVGEAVGRSRDAAVARTKGLYGQVRDEPGAFDPEMVRGLSADLRARLASGEDAVTINPQSTPRAHEALGLLDSVQGSGLFQHTAPRPAVGPVAAAVERAGAPGSALAGEDAVAALVAKGVNPERARQAIALADSQPRHPMEPHDVATPNGGSVRVVPKVVEARSVKTSADAGYNSDLQPRDRARAASGLQVDDMSKNLNPNRLGASSEADRGAPIVGPDGMVESGNGRVLAIRKAYQDGGPAAERYRTWLSNQGVDVSKFREPVMVRERATPMNAAQRKDFAVASNQAATLSMSAPERALADSKILSRDTLDLIRNPSDLGGAENRDFVRAFMSGVPASERAALMTANGELSSEGLTRVRNAVLGKAYGDTPVLSRIAESAHDDVKSISNGLVAAAPEWAQLRARIANGEVPAAMDVTGDLVDAVSRTARIRGKGVGLAESHAQADAFTKQTAESEALQKLFYGADGKSAAPASQVGNALRHYAQEAGKVQASPGLDLGLAPVSARDVLKATAAKAGAPAELAQEVAQAAAPAARGPAISDVGLKEMDAARKRLVTMYGDAKSAALRSGDRSDLRAMGRVMHEFDNAIIDAFEGGRFSGDSVVAARLLKDARASHAAYRQTFSSRGPGDEVGRSIEKILGRYTDAAATPDEIARLSYGSLSDPGGGKAARVAQRLQTILGASSPEWAAYKQGLVSYLVDTPAGTAPRSASATADRIERFLDGSQGRVLSALALGPSERTALRKYATSLRASEPVPVSSLNTAERTIARLSGRTGEPPASATDVVNQLFDLKANKETSVQLARELQTRLSPESFGQVKQGMWSRLTEAPEGMIPWESQRVSQNLHNFLKSELAKAIYTPNERMLMKTIADAHSKLIPVAGSTNPSGTAPMLSKIARGAQKQLLGLFGFSHGGLLGAGIALAAGKALNWAGNRKAANEATKLFYGAQPKITGNAAMRTQLERVMAASVRSSQSRSR